MKKSCVKGATNVEVDKIVLPDWVSVCSTEDQKTTRQVTEEFITFDNCCVTLQNGKYAKGSKNLNIEKVKLRNKNVFDKTKMHVDLSGVGTTSVTKMHQDTNDVLSQSVSQQEEKKLKIKTRIEDLEDALNSGSLLMTPLAIQITLLAISTPYISHRFSKTINLLNAVKTYIISNIYKTLPIIEHAWKTNFYWEHLVQRKKSFVDRIERDLEGENYFINNKLSTFNHKLNLLSDLEKKWQEMSNVDQIKQMKVACSHRVKRLENIILNVKTLRIEEKIPLSRLYRLCKI